MRLKVKSLSELERVGLVVFSSLKRNLKATLWRVISLKLSELHQGFTTHWAYRRALCEAHEVVDLHAPALYLRQVKRDEVGGEAVITSALGLTEKLSAQAPTAHVRLCYTTHLKRPLGPERLSLLTRLIAHPREAREQGAVLAPLACLLCATVRTLHLSPPGGLGAGVDHKHTLPHAAVTLTHHITRRGALGSLKSDPIRVIGVFNTLSEVEERRGEGLLVFTLCGGINLPPQDLKGLLLVLEVLFERVMDLVRGEL